MPRQHRSDETRVQRLALGNVGRRALGAFAGRFTVSLTSSVVCGADLFLLLVQVIASLVSPADKGRDYLNQQKEQIRSAYDAGRQAYREATSESAEGTTPNVP